MSTRTASNGRRLLGVAMALLGLLLASALAAQSHLGGWNLALSLSIALAKIALVGWYFMGLDRAPRLQRIVAAAGCAALAVLLSLAAVDFGARRDDPASWQVPQRLPALVHGRPSAPR